MVGRWLVCVYIIQVYLGIIIYWESLLTNHYKWTSEGFEHYQVANSCRNQPDFVNMGMASKIGEVATWTTHIHGVSATRDDGDFTYSHIYWKIQGKRNVRDIAYSLVIMNQLIHVFLDLFWSWSCFPISAHLSKVRYSRCSCIAWKDESFDRIRLTFWVSKSHYIPIAQSFPVFSHRIPVKMSHSLHQKPLEAPLKPI